jgi:hypothetical protein
MKKLLFAVAATLALAAGCSGQAKKKDCFKEPNFAYDIYTQNNYEWFAGKLPDDTKITWVRNLHDDETGEKYQADTSCDKIGGGLHCQIRLDKDANSSSLITVMAIFHEQCHIKTWEETKRTDADPHGPLFQGCMKDLAARGAFAEYW